MILGEFSDSFKGNLRGIFQTIDDDHLVPSEKQLQHRVASDVAGTASDQYTQRHRTPTEY